MTIYTTRLLYAGESSDTYGGLKCTIESNNSDSNDEQTSLKISKIPYKKRFDYHYLDYSDPLIFKLTIANKDGTYIDANKERMLKKWLCKENRNWLNFDQIDAADKYFYCVIHNPRKISAGNLTIAIEFDVECDAGFAWSKLYQRTYTTSSGTLNFKFFNTVDFDGYLLSPIFIITPLVNGTIKIKNNTTGDEMIINNCVTTEVITMDNETERFNSNNGRVLLDDWNKVVIDFLEGINDITLTGNFSLQLEYRLPMRIGG